MAQWPPIPCNCVKSVNCIYKQHETDQSEAIFLIENDYLKKYFTLGIHHFNKLEIMLMIPYP